jgi:competence protein ComEC
LAALQDAIARWRIETREVFAGDWLTAGEGCTIEVFHPPRRGYLANDNANSLTLAVECHGRRILLPGDLSSPGLEALLAEEPWDCDVLMAPHHGSRQSDPPGLAEWCRPEYVVISGSNRYDVDETSRTYRAAGAWTLHTARTGAVTVWIDRTRLVVAPLLSPAPDGP